MGNGTSHEVIIRETPIYHPVFVVEEDQRRSFAGSLRRRRQRYDAGIIDRWGRLTENARRLYAEGLIDDTGHPTILGGLHPENRPPTAGGSQYPGSNHPGSQRGGSQRPQGASVTSTHRAPSRQPSRTQGRLTAAPSGSAQGRSASGNGHHGGSTQAGRSHHAPTQPARSHHGNSTRAPSSQATSSTRPPSRTSTRPAPAHQAVPPRGNGGARRPPNTGGRPPTNPWFENRPRQAASPASTHGSSRAPSSSGTRQAVRSAGSSSRDGNGGRRGERLPGVRGERTRSGHSAVDGWLRRRRQ